MNTLKMAQCLYENPEKTFVGTNNEGTTFIAKLQLGSIMVNSGPDYMFEPADIEYLYRGEFSWEEKKTPRRWNGQYAGAGNGNIQSGKIPHDVIPNDVSLFVLTWEAEEKLQ